MSDVVLAGPPLPLARGAEVIREIAPLVLGRPLALVEVEREALDDLDGRSACWRALWRDGEVELEASVANGPGNPRDGYGYTMSAKLSVPAPGPGPQRGWRAELYAGGYEPELTGPIRLHLFGVSPEGFDAIRARLAVLLPEYRDVTFEDPYAVGGIVADFDRQGHVEWVRAFLAQPLVPGVRWVTDALCERKVALRGADPETARTWVTLAPFASRGWASLADAGGDATTSAEAARFLAALTHPFSPVAIERAAAHFPVEGTALAAAMAHVFRDPRWRWLAAEDRDAYEARAASWQPAPSRRVVWERPVARSYDASDAEMMRVLRVPRVARPELLGHSASGPPLADEGTLSHRCGIGTGHSLRRAAIDVAEPVGRSRAVALCHVNCEDRLAGFGLAWLDAAAQVVWRWSSTEEGGVARRSAIEIDVIDVGDGAMGDAWVAALEAARG